MKTYTKNLIPAVGSLAFTVIASLQAAGRVETETPAIPSKRMVGVFCVRPYSLRLAEDDPGRSCFCAWAGVTGRGAGICVAIVSKATTVGKVWSRAGRVNRNPNVQD